MREEVVEHFKRSWGPSVVSLIAGVTSTVAQQDGILRITAESQDPKLSAELANYYLKHLEVLLARKGKRLKDLQHQFYASRLEPARQDLEEAQKTILAFQEKHRTLGLSAGTQAAVAGSAAGATSVIGLEMQRTLKRMYLTDRHPEMIALDRQIYEAKRLVSHSLWGEPGLLPPPPQEGPNAPPRKEYFVAAAKLTPLQWQAVDVLRTLQIRVGVHQMIATNLELAKYQSDVPPPQIEVVDPAIPPGGPSKPNVQTYVRTAALGSLVVGIFLAFFLEYLERVRGLERVARVDRRREHGLVPAPEMANGPLSAELFNGTSPESYADESASRFFDRRRSAAPVIREGPRLL
jgi:tyrosine-protein kinase Etk/Wzc